MRLTLTLATLITLVMLTARSSVAQTKELFVSPSGAGSTCSAAAPCLLAPAFAAADTSGGATIILKAGEYHANKIELFRTSTVGAIVIKSETPLAAKIIIDNCVAFSGIYVRGLNITIEGLDVAATKCDDAFLVTGSAGTSGNITIRHNYIHDVGQTSNFIAPSLGCPGGAPITVSGTPDADKRIVIDGNIFKKSGPPGVCGYQHGLYIDAGNVTITNNQLSDVSGYCIQLWGNASNNVATANVVVAHNTMSNCRAGGFVAGTQLSRDGGFRNSLVFNNIISDSPRCFYETSTVGKITYSNNDCFNTADGTTALSRSGGTTNIDGTQNTALNTLFVDPQFVAPPTDNHLKAGSPMIDHGAELSPIATDYDGAPRKSGSAPDIGAFEFSSTSTSPTGPACSVLPGDANHDGTISLADYSVWRAAFIQNHQ